METTNIIKIKKDVYYHTTLKALIQLNGLENCNLCFVNCTAGNSKYLPRIKDESVCLGSNFSFTRFPNYLYLKED